MPAIIVSEDFTASNGTALQGLVPDVGPAYCNAPSNYDIQSNRARQTGGTGLELAVWQSAYSNCIISTAFRWTAGSNYAVGLMCRYSDASNYWGVYMDGAPGQAGWGGLVIAEVNAGSYTQRALAGSTYISSGVDYQLVLTLSGTSISVNLLDAGGGQLATTSYTSSFNQSATQHGYLTYAPYGGTYQFDDFRITANRRILIDGMLVNNSTLLNGLA